MDLLQEHASRKLNDYKKAQRAADAAEALLITLGLNAIDEAADSMNAYHREVYDYGAQKYISSPRLGITIRIPAENKAQVRDQLAAVLDSESIDPTRWSKDHYTQSTHNKPYDTELVEQWSIEWDGWSQGSGAVFNALTVRFYQEAISGMIVGDNGCTVGTVKTAHPGTPARITEAIGLVCEVPK